MTPTTDHRLTALRVTLTALFLYFGLRKLLGGTADIEIYNDLGFGQWPRYVTGSVEVTAALLLWLPGAQAIAGLLLVATMITGLSGLLLFTDRAFWHLIVLGFASAAIVIAYRHQLVRFLPSPR
ncbi:DoxX family membrane protein [Aestuariibius sp. 2305UL40-4]|uniref:DoxX family membrane protein n=1 Tax=Aestuariibius violaceus TaxID=3234132 RepID=UPI00345E8E68